MADTHEETVAAKGTLAEYDARILRLEGELKTLKAMRDKIAQSIEFLENVPKVQDVEDSVSAKPVHIKRSNLNLGEKIEIILQEASKEGLETKEIKAAMEKKWPHEGVNISSLRTNISTLRGNNIITREKKKWRLTGK